MDRPSQAVTVPIDHDIGLLLELNRCPLLVATTYADDRLRIHELVQGEVDFSFNPKPFVDVHSRRDDHATSLANLLL